MFRKIFLTAALFIPMLISAQPYLEQGLVAFWPFNGNANDFGARSTYILQLIGGMQGAVVFNRKVVLQ